MDQLAGSSLHKIEIPDFEQAWEIVRGQLRLDMSKAMFENWVQPLRPLTFQDHVFTVGALNPYTRDWIESRLKSRIANLLSGLYNDSVTLKIDVINDFYQKSTVSVGAANPPKEEIPAEKPAPRAGKTELSQRKVMLQRAYGSKRAAVIQPERGLFVTLYLFNNWLPLIGHSAFATILAARSMCYWNPMTGELRNQIETEMGELAKRAAVSVRTVKDVLNSELVKRYFLRYKVRRMMTPNGIRTAGILLQVRMDDPLTPDQQDENQLIEEDHWYSAEFENEEYED